MLLRKEDMHPVQQRAVTKLYESDAVQAVIPMGGGKTVICMTAIRELIDDRHIRCSVGLAPNRVAKSVWPREPDDWEHLRDNMRVAVVNGNEAERLAVLASDADVYMVPLHFIPWFVDWLKKQPLDSKFFDHLFVDESSKLKAPRGTWGKKLQGISRRWKIKWWLTGTPRPNGYVDQFRPLAILTGGKVWGTPLFDVWREKHFMRTDYEGYNWEIRPEHEARLIKKIASVTFTIDPADLPRRDTPNIIPVWVDLPPDAMKVYKEMETKMVAKFGDDIAALAANRGVATGKLCQIAQGFLYADDGTVKDIHTVKYDTLIEMDDQLAGDPAVYVYGFTSDLNLMQDAWPGFPYLGGGVSDAQATQYEDDWNTRKLPRLGLHPGSAAHGLNLQRGGNQMIIYDLPWSPELYDQIIRRIDRPGQSGQVFVHLILARGTIDEVKFNRVVERMSDQDAFRAYLRKI